MPDLYKVVVNKKISNRVFTFQKARKLVKHYKELGFQAKKVLYKEDVKIYDLVEDGTVEFFMEAKEEDDIMEDSE